MKRRATREPNICDCREHAFVVGTKGLTSLLDVEDIAAIKGWKWSALCGKYLARRDTVTGATISLHQVIIGRAEGCQVDHIDGDTLNNRRANLRHVTKAENQMNRHAVVARSGFKGVFRNKKRWSALISRRENGKRNHYYLGTFDTREMAAAAYDDAALKLFGEFAKTNFVPTIADSAASQLGGDR